MARVSPRLALSIPETARRLGVSAWTVREMIRHGELPSLRIHHRVLIPAAELQEWVRAHTRPPRKVS